MRIIATLVINILVQSNNMNIQSHVHNSLLANNNSDAFYFRWLTQILSASLNDNSSMFLLHWLYSNFVFYVLDKRNDKILSKGFPFIFERDFFFFFAFLSFFFFCVSFRLWKFITFFFFHRQLYCQTRAKYWHSKNGRNYTRRQIGWFDFVLCIKDII